MYCIRAFLPLLLLPFPSTAPYFVILYSISLYRHHRPCVYCIFTVILLFSTTCYWGADRCWLDLNHFRLFDPIRHMDGSPTSTFGIQLPAFVSKIEDYLESLLRILGGGEPLAAVIRAGSDFSSSAAAGARTVAAGTGHLAVSAATAAVASGGAAGTGTLAAASVPVS
ncbi:hypothetical protein BGZ67_005833 [Mortierella alpina]|nr:hypothetical protein BGZ67_005833 [Mortierella alpina]